jgi:pSer/pThr/pTyr-binding forkhead associated (FHA) protein
MRRLPISIGKGADLLGESVMLTFNAFQAIPGNVYVLLALLAAICILLVVLLLFLLRNSKRASNNSDVYASVDDYVQEPAQQPSQKLWYQQGLQDQAHEEPGFDAQLPLPHNIKLHQPVLERAELNNASSGIRQTLQPVSVEDHCPLCGKAVLPTDIFCMNCGNRLKLASPQLTSVKRSAVRDARSSSADGASSLVVNEWSSISSPERMLLEYNTVPQKLANRVEMNGHLTLRSGNKSLRDYPLNKPQTFIGRSTNNDIMIVRDKLTSRHHAIVRYEDGRYVLFDDHSANGTYLNGRKIATVSAYPLNDGDVVKIGVNEFLFHIVDAQSIDIEDVPTLAVELYAGAQDPKRSSVEEPLPHMITDIHAPLVENPSPPVTQTASPVHIPDTPVEVPSQQMSFTTFHPKEVSVDVWNTLLVYAHQDATTTAVYEDADRFRQELEDIPAGLSSPLEQPLLPATNITIVPECKGIVFNPRRLSFKWTDNWHRLMFRFSIKKDLLAAGITASGRISIFAGPLLIATLKTSMMFTEQTQLEQVSGVEATTRPYKHVFASYSKEDVMVAQAYRDVSHLLGVDVQAREATREREVVNNLLKQAIEEAEVFQLFWSSHAAQSAYIRQEWEYALKLQKSEDFLRPMYWDVPLIAPPDQLAALPFTYLPSYTFHK